RRLEISPATQTLPTPPSSVSRTSAASWVTVRTRGAGSARSIARAYISPFAARHEGLEDLPALEQLERVVELRVGAELALLDVRRRPLGRPLSGGRGLALLPFPLFGLPAAPVPRPVRLAQRARDDLRGAGASTVHQHDHRAVGPRTGRVREVLLLLVLEPAVGVDDEAGVEEEVRHLDRLGQEAARIVAQIEDQALEASRLLVQVLERPLEVVVGALLELRHAHVAVALLEHLRLDAL